jgi:hypothetical protein
MVVRFTPDTDTQEKKKKPLRFIPDEGSMSRTELANFGVTQKTSARDRQVITNNLRRRATDLRPDGTVKGKGFKVARRRRCKRILRWRPVGE